MSVRVFLSMGFVSVWDCSGSVPSGSQCIIAINLCGLNLSKHHQRETLNAHITTTTSDTCWSNM